LGPGNYDASFLLRDDLGRACRAEWRIDIPADRHLSVAIAPGEVRELGWSGGRPAAAPGETLRKLTVLLHAAPVLSRLSSIQASDAVTLLGALSSLMELAPAQQVKLVVFNLEQQKEIYRDEHFTGGQLEAVRQAMFDLQLAAVDVHTLQSAGRMEVLDKLVQEELHAETPSDAVVFLGPRARSTAAPAFEVGKPGAGGPKFFYLEYLRPQRVRSATGRGGQSCQQGGVAGGDVYSSRMPIGGCAGTDDLPAETAIPRDTIDRLVSMLKGKTLMVRTPAEFAAAVRQIRPAKGGKTLQ